jgi:hypothetical protein
MLRSLQLHQIEQENRALAAKTSGDRVLGRLITAAPEMVKVARTIERVANTNVSVLLLGESGTGKELLAKGLHEASDRAGRAFVAINARRSPKPARPERAPSPARSRPPRARSSRPTAAPCPRRGGRYTAAIGQAAALLAGTVIEGRSRRRGRYARGLRHPPNPNDDREGRFA